MSFSVFLRLMTCQPFWETPQQLAALSVIANFQNPKSENWAWPKISTIAEKLCLSERQTIRLLQQLERNATVGRGGLTIERRKEGDNHTISRYQVQFPDHDTGVRNEDADVTIKPQAACDRDADVTNVDDAEGAVADIHDTIDRDTGNKPIVTPVSPDPISSAGHSNGQENLQGERACGARDSLDDDKSEGDEDRSIVIGFDDASRVAKTLFPSGPTPEIDSERSLADVVKGELLKSVGARFLHPFEQRAVADACSAWWHVWKVRGHVGVRSAATESGPHDASRFDLTGSIHDEDDADDGAGT